jgi:hypothetical protein
MAGSLAVPLAETLDLVEGEVIAREIEHAVEQHGAMSGREDEAIAVDPVGIARIVLEKLGPEHIGCVCHSHRHTGMARVSLLDSISR